MKKQLFLMSALALTALASCGSQQSSGIKVGLICLHDKNSTYDANFISAFESACEKAKSEGKISDYSYVTDVPETDECYNAAERFVNQGYKIIFSDSYGHDPYMGKAARDFPDVFFSSATGDKANAYGDSLQNYHNAFASIYEGRYLAGVAAGQYLIEHGYKEKDVPLGYVGAFNYAEVRSGYTSWYLGVKSLLPQATMKVVFTNSWYDYELEFSAAKRLIDEEKCVLISQHADSMGTPNACKSYDPAIPNVSYNINTAADDPTCAKSYVAHSRINWEPYYETVLNAQGARPIPGEKGHDWTGTLASGSVEYNVSDLVEDKSPIEKAAEELKAGKLHVFDTKNFTYTITKDDAGVEVDGESTVGKSGQLTKYEVNLNGDWEGGTPIMQDIVDVKNHYIKESEYRSAPSFGLVIDGITELAAK